MKIHKKQKSHRMPARRRYNIEKKVREHKRKMRKVAKKESQKSRFKVTSTPRISVPSEAPFKEQVLLEAEKAREERKLEIEAEKKEARERLKAKAAEDEEEEGDLSTKPDVFEGRKVYPRKSFETSDAEAGVADFTQVVEKADVIIQVVDARDPLGTRCIEVEGMVKDAGKSMIVLLNKADLVPRMNLLLWLTYFRKHHPTLAFKSAVSWKKVLSRMWHSKKMKKKRKRLRKKKSTARNWFLLRKKFTMETSGCVGVDTLMDVIDNYRQKKGLAALCIGIVGYHQVGKNSVYNSLLGYQNQKEEEEDENSDEEKENEEGKEEEIESDEEETEAKMKQVAITEHVKILDCRGLVPSEDTLLSYSSLPRDDYLPVIEALISRLPLEPLLLRYSLGDFTDAEDFLKQFALKKCLLKKKGVPHVDKAAKMFYEDWQSGRLRCYSEVNDAKLEEEELPGLPGDFHLEDLQDAERRNINMLNCPNLLSCMKLKQADDTAEKDDMEMDSESTQHPKRRRNKNKKKKTTNLTEDEVTPMITS